MNNDRIKILIADDEEIYTSILEYILSSSYDVSIATCGMQAMEMAKEIVPDLILLDVLMPDITGFEVLKQLKDDHKTQNIPVIFITGLNASEDEELGFFLGAIDYITKPFVNSILMARVRTHVQIINHIRTIEQMGLIDSLTSLPNRRGFDERFALEWERAIREHSPISLLFMDMDKFKSYNDTYGHPFGDSLIQLSGKIYQKTLNRATDFVSRWGGDEFVILLPSTDKEGACAIAEKIRVAIATATITVPDGSNVPATVSIGVHSITPNKDDDIDLFMDRTDKALYAAKKEGRNRYHLYDESRAHIYETEEESKEQERRNDAAAAVSIAIQRTDIPARKTKAETSEFMKKIRSVSILDVEGALASIGGSEELYERILKMIVQGVPRYVAQTEKSLFTDNDIRDFTIKIHSIKSSLNQIGYKKLASLTEVLESAARKGDEAYCREYYSIFKDTLLSFHKQVSEIDNLQDAGDSGGSDNDSDNQDIQESASLNALQTQDADANVEFKKILVVDDSVTNLTLMKGILSSFYKVFPVNSGEAALKFLDKQLPNLILLDVEMPGMSGKELLQIIKSKPHLADIPVIFLTGLADMDSEAEAFTLGAADYIRKPVNDVIMLHRVKTQLELDDLRK